MSALLASLRPERRHLVDALAIVAMTAAALLAFRDSYGGVAFLVNGAIATAVGILVAYIGHRLSWNIAVTAVFGLVVYVLVANVLALRSLAIAGVVPSPDGMLTAVTKIVTGWKELITTAPPVGYTGGLMAVPVLAGFIAGFTSASLAWRTRAAVLALVTPFVVLGLGIATGIERPVSVLVSGGGIAAVAFAWLAWREHRRRPLLQATGLPVRRLVSGAVVLGIAAAGGVLLAPRILLADSNPRAIWRQTVTPPFDPRQYPSPLASYRAYVKDGDIDEVTQERINVPVAFTIEGLPEGVPVRLATMDAYDGLVWQVSSGDVEDPSLNDSGSFERVGAALRPEFDGPTAEVTVTIGEYADVWIPDVGEVLSLRFTGSSDGPERDRALADSFRYNQATDTAATPLRLQAGDRYEMTVRLPHLAENVEGLVLVPQVQRLGNAEPVGPLVEKLNSPELSAMSTANERLDAVAETMRTYGAYSDGDKALGQIRARSGHDNKRLSDFVGDYPERSLVGNAEQYASAYALLFRALDRLPTRVVMGFVPSESSLDGPVDVLRTEVEAWVEVPVEELGWVAIFPTPDREQTSTSSSSPVQPEPDYRTQNPPPPPLVDPEFDQPATAKGKAQASEEQAKETPPEPSGPSALSRFASSPVTMIVAIALSPLLLLLLAGVVVVFVKSRRRQRRRRRGEPHQRIANGWREVTDLATDLGRPVPSGVTRREAAAFASANAGPLAVRTDAAVWGGDALTDEDVDRYWGELVTTLEAMKHEVGLIDRVKASVSLHSLWRRGHNKRGSGR